MIDEKIARVKQLIQQREAIDVELAAIFGLAEQPKRGRPKKEQTSTTNGTAVVNSPEAPEDGKISG
jgi:hypothetical protein